MLIAVLPANRDPGLLRVSNRDVGEASPPFFASHQYPATVAENSRHFAMRAPGLSALRHGSVRRGLPVRQVMCSAEMITCTVSSDCSPVRRRRR
jgi:hypothetical protein